MNILRANLIVTAAAAAASLALLMPGLAAADPPISTTQLPLTSFGDIAVDPARGHVFVSGGPGNSSVVVLDLNGTVVETITGLQGAAGMVYDSGSSRLHVALHDARAIATIDAGTLAEIGRIDVAAGPEPFRLGLAGGRFWFCKFGDMASVATDGVGLRQYAGNVTTFPNSCEGFATTAASANTLAVFQGDSPTFVFKYDVSADPATFLQRGAPEGGNPQDMVFAQDGQALLLASGAPYFLQELAFADLSRTGVYQTGPYPTAVAISDDGEWVAGGVLAGSPRVYVFPRGTSDASRDYTFAEDLHQGGLAFSPNGRKLYAVSGSFGGGLALHVLSNRLQTSLGVTLSRSKVTYGGRVHVTAHLEGTGEDGGTVSVYAVPHKGSRRLVERGEVDADGNLRATDLPKKATEYYAVYEGDETYERATSARREVKVAVVTTSRLAGFYATAGRVKLFHRGSPVRQTGKVVPNHRGQRLRFEAQVLRGGRWRTVATASFRIRANGSVTAIFTSSRVGIPFRARNVFSADRDHLGDASPWVFFRFTR